MTAVLLLGWLALVAASCVLSIVALGKADLL